MTDAEKDTSELREGLERVEENKRKVLDDVTADQNDSQKVEDQQDSSNS